MTRHVEPLPDWVKPGTAFKLLEYGTNTVYHVVAIVDGNRAVLKYWRKAKQRWDYFVECPIYFELWKDRISR